MAYTIGTPGDRPVGRRTKDCFINAVAVAMDLPYQGVAATATLLFKKRSNWNGSMKVEQVTDLIKFLNSDGLYMWSPNPIHVCAWNVAHPKGVPQARYVPYKLRPDNPAVIELPSGPVEHTIKERRVKYISKGFNGRRMYSWAIDQKDKSPEIVKKYRYILIAGEGRTRHAVAAEYDPERDEWFAVDQVQGLHRLHDTRTKGRAPLQCAIAIEKG